MAAAVDGCGATTAARCALRICACLLHSPILPRSAYALAFDRRRLGQLFVRRIKEMQPISLIGGKGHGGMENVVLRWDDRCMKAGNGLAAWRHDSGVVATIASGAAHIPR